MLWIVDTAHFDGSVKTWLPDGSACPYTGKTAAEFAAEGYAVLTDDQLDELLDRYQSGLCGRWSEITEAEYLEQLNVLPPVGYDGAGFWMSERYTGDVTAYYQRLDGRYYTSLQRMSTPRAEILASLRQWIASRA